MVRRYDRVLSTSMSCHVKKSARHVGTQTVIIVYPHLLEHQQTARVISNKRMQTEVSIRPEDKTEKFYSLLRFTPYQDIQEDCVRIIDLPRKVHLQFNPGVEFDKMAQVARQFSLADDDGVGYICCELIHRLENRHRQLAYAEIGVQTELNVYPHLLKDEHVATVKGELSFQTDPDDGVGSSGGNDDGSHHEGGNADDSDDDDDMVVPS